jgi:hypothetical protein
MKLAFENVQTFLYSTKNDGSQVSKPSVTTLVLSVPMSFGFYDTGGVPGSHPTRIEYLCLS